MSNKNDFNIQKHRLPESTPLTEAPDLHLLPSSQIVPAHEVSFQQVAFG